LSIKAARIVPLTLRPSAAACSLCALPAPPTPAPPRDKTADTPHPFVRIGAGFPGFLAGSAQGFWDNRRISRGTASPFTPAGGALHLESYTRRRRRELCGSRQPPPRHTLSLPHRPGKASRSLGRSSRSLGHRRHATWAIPRHAPSHGLSLALEKRCPSGDTPYARPVQRNSSRLRVARIGPPILTKSVDRPTYPDKSGSLSVTTCPPSRCAPRPCILKTYSCAVHRMTSTRRRNSSGAVGTRRPTSSLRIMCSRRPPLPRRSRPSSTWPPSVLAPDLDRRHGLH